MNPRRQFLKGGIALTLVLAGPAAAKPKDEDEVSPTEDLMREHGVLRRLLLVYRELLRRLDAREALRPELITQPAEIVRAFIEDYHERDEEEYIFPRFQKAARMTELVAVLQQQHQAGRRLTADVMRLAPGAAPANASDRPRLADALRQFLRMYEPHAAREDTVLFPAFRRLIGAKELDQLQDVFEDKEKALPRGGFEKMVVEVAGIEQALGIADLAQFTPRLT
jgi:hemerythrin-like domain-containing protein